MSAPSRLLIFALSFTACTGGGPTDADDGDDDSMDPPGEVAIGRFLADQTNVASGGTAVLSYSVSSATQVSIVAEPGGALLSGSSLLMDSIRSKAILETTVFTLTAQGAGGSKQATVTVSVDPAAVKVWSFTAVPDSAAVGSMVVLSWTTSGATKVRLSEGTTELFMSTTAVSEGSFTVTAERGPHGYTLEASNEANADTETLILQTRALARVDSFFADRTTFNAPSVDVTLTWSAEGDKLRLTANDVEVPAFTGARTGTITVTITDTTEFELSAFGIDGPQTAAVLVAYSTDEIEPNNNRATANPIFTTVTAAIDPTDDVDYFSFEVPEGGYVIALADGCAPDGFAIALELQNSRGERITGDSSAGPDMCGYINPSWRPEAASLPAGTYYLRATNYIDPEARAVEPYSLTLFVEPPVCGNTVIEYPRGEQCDDGGTSSGDGCEADCTFPNIGTISAPGGMFNVPVSGTTYTWIEVEIATAGQSITATSSDGLGGCPFRVFFDVRAPTGESDYLLNAPFPCASIDPRRLGDTAATDLAPGTYLLGVYGVSMGMVNVQVGIVEPGCGNRVFERRVGETCDDGNLDANDGCSPSCQIEPEGAVIGLGQDQTFAGSLDSAEDADLYRLVIDVDGYLFAEVGAPVLGTCSGSPEYGLTLYDSALRDLGYGSEIGFNSDCRRIDPNLDDFAALAPGTYFLKVDSYTVIPAYEVQIRTLAAGCGNAVTERALGEQCDDGNTANGDGCNSGCVFEGVTVEVEPNDAPATATPIALPLNQTVTLNGAVDPAGEHDFYTFNVPQGATLIARTYTSFLDPAACMRYVSPSVVLRDSAGVVAMAPYQGFGFCSGIDGNTDPAAANLPAGTYYLDVDDFNLILLDDYFVDIRLE